jgi:hypothetical protein
MVGKWTSAGTFSVEWSNGPEADVQFEKVFDYDEAVRLAVAKSHEYPCVWIGEIGEYEEFGKRFRKYFWWTEPTGYGRVSGRGSGYPSEDDEGVEDDLKEYTPVSQLKQQKRV